MKGFERWVIVFGVGSIFVGSCQSHYCKSLWLKRWDCLNLWFQNARPVCQLARLAFLRLSNAIFTAGIFGSLTKFYLLLYCCLLVTILWIFVCICYVLTKFWEELFCILFEAICERYPWVAVQVHEEVYFCVTRWVLWLRGSVFVGFMLVFRCFGCWISRVVHLHDVCYYNQHGKVDSRDLTISQLPQKTPSTS